MVHIMVTLMLSALAPTRNHVYLNPGRTHTPGLYWHPHTGHSRRLPAFKLTFSTYLLTNTVRAVTFGEQTSPQPQHTGLYHRQL